MWKIFYITLKSNYIYEVYYKVRVDLALLFQAELKSAQTCNEWFFQIDSNTNENSYRFPIPY